VGTLPILRIPLGERLCLRVHEERFALEYCAAIQRDRPYLREWLPWLDEEQSVEDTRAYIRAILSLYAQNQGFHCAIWYEETIVGSIGYHLDRQTRMVELGYWLGSAYQGKGIATRASRALVNYAFEHLGLNKVEIHCATGNRRSCAVAERLGFVREGVIRDEEWPYDHFVDCVVYGMRASAWQACKERRYR
jgi:ribosomal-protein-serine acetyltransferase